MKAIADYQAPPDLLRDRVILVTGAGDGIGRAAALSYAQFGATVVLLGRTIAKLEAVYDQIEEQRLPQAAIYPMNLEGAAVKDYEELAQRIEHEFGRLDGILHNAAELGELTPMQQFEPETWYRVLQVNLTAPFLITRACLDQLNRAADASVLFVSDRVGRKGHAYWGAYGVSKFGLEGLMQTWAEETQKHTAIRFNSIDPGAVLTRMRRAAFPAEDPAGLVMPEQVMAPFLYLMGPDSAGVTGQQFLAQPPSPEQDA